MNINEAIYTGSYVSRTTALGDGKRSRTGIPAAGDILEGTVLGTNGGTRVSLKQEGFEREVSFPDGTIRDTYAGDVRRFEVMEASDDRLVLRDLGSVYGEEISRGMQSVTVNAGLVTMVEDFSETMGTKEKEDESSIERLSDKDYSELRSEGFSIEKFKAERLSRAIERVKTALRNRREDAEETGSRLRRETDRLKKQAGRKAAGTDGLEKLIAQKLEYADLPVTKENIADIAESVRMSSVAADMDDGAYVFLIKNELSPTPSNIYRSVYAGSPHAAGPDDGAWRELEAEAARIAAEAGSDSREARWCLDYDIPLTVENLRYKKALEGLKNEYASQGAYRTIDEAVAAIDSGRRAADAVLTYYPGGAGQAAEAGLTAGATGRAGDAGQGADGGQAGGAAGSAADTDRISSAEIGRINARLGLETARLKLTVSAARVMIGMGVDPRTDELENIVGALKELEDREYRRLAEELGVAPEDSPEAGAAAAVVSRTQDISFAIAGSDGDVFAATFEARHRITYPELGLAVTRYEASATEVRRDLGDSIERAFGDIDGILGAEGIELTDASRLAARILARNSMELSAQNINDMKFYSSKVLGLAEKLQPAVVMGLIRKGVNPLDLDIDTLDREVNALLDEEGYSAEEKYSEFLYKMERRGDVTDAERTAYIGIYRLLYRVSSDDGAAIGAAIRSGRKLTLRNLLTESRSRTGTGVNESVGEDTELRRGTIVNAIDREIGEAFAYQRNVIRGAASFTEPETWKDALPGGEGAEDITPEELYEKLKNADNGIRVYDGAAETVREMMISDPGARRFLRSFGLDAGTDELKALNSAEAVDVADREELLGMLAGERGPADSYDELLAQARANVLTAMRGDISADTASSLTAQLARYDLLKDFAGERRYEYRVGGPAGTKVNLTVIGGTGGPASVHIEVRGDAGPVRADIEMSADGSELKGRVTCEGDEIRKDLEGSFDAFEAGLNEEGFDTMGIRFLTDKVSDTRYRDRLGEIKRRAAQQAQTAGGDTEVADSEGLYRVARKFLEYFL